MVADLSSCWTSKFPRRQRDVDLCNRGSSADKKLAMRKLQEVIKPLVTEKHYCHDRDMSILVAVKNFFGKKCWLITIKKKAKVRFWRRIEFFTDFPCDYLYFQAFLPPMIPMPWTKSLCSQTKNSKNDEPCWLTVWGIRVNQKIWRKKNLEIVLIWNWKQKSIFGISETKALQKKTKTEGLSSFQSYK